MYKIILNLKDKTRLITSSEYIGERHIENIKLGNEVYEVYFGALEKLDSKTYSAIELDRKKVKYNNRIDVDEYMQRNYKL